MCRFDVHRQYPGTQGTHIIITTDEARFVENFELKDILLVEDSEFEAELSVSGLRDCPCTDHIIWVNDGQQAIDYLFREGAFSDRDPVPPRLVMLDLQMPRMNGIDVLRIIKADERTRHIPVVMMTSSREDVDLAKAYELGVNSYVVKPLQFETMKKVMSEAAHYWLEINQSHTLV